MADEENFTQKNKSSSVNLASFTLDKILASG
jgi:hypothetical protein